MAIWWMNGFDPYSAKELKDAMAIKYDDIMKSAVEQFKKFGGGEKLKPTQKQEDYYTTLPHSLKTEENSLGPTVHPSVKNYYDKFLQDPLTFKGIPLLKNIISSFDDVYVPDEAPTLPIDQETLKTIGSCLGKVIEKVMLATDHEEKESVMIVFTDGTALSLFDEGQQCCEKRWLASDDKSEDVAGGTLMDVHMEEGVDDEGPVNIVESQFIRIITDKAPYVVTAYNEHNGNYEGIKVKAEIGTVTKS